MTDPTPPDPMMLDDAALDRLLGHAETPPMSADFADRVLAEAAREDRVVRVPPLPPRLRTVHRPWTRRGVWAGLIAVNLIVASAIAATVTGVAPRLAPHFAHVMAVAAHVLHIHRHEVAPPEPIHHVMPRVTRPEPIRPLPFARAMPSDVRPMPMRPDMHPPLLARPIMRPPLRANAMRHPRGMLGQRGPHPFAHVPPRLRQPPAFRSGQGPGGGDRLQPRPFGRPHWGMGPQRPWAAPGWRAPGNGGMRPWRANGPGWRKPGRFGSGGAGRSWRRPFGRNRRF
jgi:hypothetical protein